MCLGLFRRKDFLMLEVVVIYLGGTAPSGERTRRKKRTVRVIVNMPFQILQIGPTADKDLFCIQVYIADIFNAPKTRHRRSRGRGRGKSRNRGQERAQN